MEESNEFTTIPIRRLTLRRLQTEKIHPNQSYDELINILLDEREEFDKKKRG